MTFKEEVAADIYGVFLQDDEFAEYHRIEGKSIPCVIDSDKGQPKNGGDMYALAEADFVVIAKTADLPKRKEAGEVLNLDGRELTVAAWDEQSGMTVIGLQAPVMT